MAEEGKIIHATGSAEVSAGIRMVVCLRTLFLVCVRVIGTVDK